MVEIKVNKFNKMFARSSPIEIKPSIANPRHTHKIKGNAIRVWDKYNKCYKLIFREMPFTAGHGEIIKVEQNPLNANAKHTTKLISKTGKLDENIALDA